MQHLSEREEELAALAARLRALADGESTDDGASAGEGESGPGTVEAVFEAARVLEARSEADRRRLADNIESLERTNRELRAARDQVIRAARLASVGTLAAGIAHEVGNPLGAILGFVDVARGRAQREGRDPELLDAIRAEAVRIDRIVRGLLDYARPAVDGAEWRSAGEIIEKVRVLLENQGRLTRVTATWDIGAGASRRFQAPQRLEQVLVNLLLNALHAVDGAPDPRVVVRLRTEEGSILRMPVRREGDPPEVNYLHRRREELDEMGPASVATSEETMVIEVEDNGPGIPSGLLEQIFDPFFTTKEPGEGTGLGLAICARLIEGMGGEIDAEPGRAGGARFLIRLPMTYDGEDPDDGTTQETA